MLCVWPSCPYFFSWEAQRLADHGDPLSMRNHSTEGGRSAWGYTLEWPEHGVGIMPQCMWINSSLWKEDEIYIYGYFKALAKSKIFIKPGLERRRKSNINLCPVFFLVLFLFFSFNVTLRCFVYYVVVVWHFIMCPLFLTKFYHGTNSTLSWKSLYNFPKGINKLKYVIILYCQYNVLLTISNAK